MTDAAGNPIKGLRAFLAAHPDVDGAVYGGRLPASEIEADPPNKTVVVRFAGEPGLFGRGYQQYGDVRIDIFCTAATDIAALDLHRQVYGALKQMRRQVAAGVLLHWAEPAGGGGQSVDADTGWPQVLSTWQVLVAEMEVA